MIQQSKPQIFTITEINRAVRYLLEDRFFSIWVEGEVSNLLQHSSGHWYFSLKDRQAQIRCAMFRSNNLRLNFNPVDGMHVLVRAKVSLYENRGDYQLIVDHMEDAGLGALQRQFEQLKNKLEKNGLFLETHKKTVPAFPETIGVITSPTGAAIRDILHVLKRRYSYANIIIYPVLVQGDMAADQIATAIKTANERAEVDVLILARGGGSLEDLWAFNEEIVANAIFESALPIVSGVGHEIDFTIADFAADVRAPTPSAAAETVSPDTPLLLSHLEHVTNQLTTLICLPIDHFNSEMKHLKKRLMQCHPQVKVEQQSQQLDRLGKSLNQAQAKTIDNKKHQLKALAGALHAISPLSTLSRGYSILTNQEKQIVYQTKQVKMGDKLSIRLSDGGVSCIIT